MSQVSADLVLFSCLLTIYAHNVVGPTCQETLGGSILFFHTLTWWALMSSSPRTSADSYCLLPMLTMREGGAAASAPNRAEDVGVNDLGDGGAAMRALRRSQPWEAEAGGPAGAGLVLAAGGRQD